MLFWVFRFYKSFSSHNHFFFFFVGKCHSLPGDSLPLGKSIKFVIEKKSWGKRKEKGG